MGRGANLSHVALKHLGRGAEGHFVVEDLNYRTLVDLVHGAKVNLDLEAVVYLASGAEVGLVCGAVINLV